MTIAAQIFEEEKASFNLINGAPFAAAITSFDPTRVGRYQIIESTLTYGDWVFDGYSYRKL